MIDLDGTITTRPEVAAALRELETEHGQLTPEVVLQAARSKNHPLHNAGFEWDRDQAAHKFNIEVARSLIRVVKYRIETSDHGVVKAPVYVRDPHAEHASQGYIALRKIVAKSPDAYAIIISEVDQVVSHLNRAMSVGVVLGFADRISGLIDDATAFKTFVEKDAEKRSKAA